MLISTSKTVALCSFSNLINAADRAIMPIAILQMAPEYKWNLHAQGWILSAFSIGYFSSQIIGAGFAKRFGGKNVLTFAVLVWSLLTFLTPLIAALGTPLLITCRIALGMAEGIGLPAVVQIFSTCVLTDERSRAFGYLIAFGSVGQTVAAIICPHLRWRWMFLVFGSIGFLWVIAWSFYFKEIKLASSEEDDFIIIPPKIMLTNNRHKWWWLDYFRHAQLLCIYLAHFAMSWTTNIITVWLPYYLSKHLGISQTALSFTAVPYIFNSLSSILAGHLADSLLVSKKWSVLSIRRTMTTVGLVGPALFLLVFMNVDNLVLSIIIISLCMCLLACNSCGHLANHLDISPNYSSISFAISNSIATISGIICGPLTAELVVKSGGRWSPVFLLTAATNFVAAIIYYSHSGSNQIL